MTPAFNRLWLRDCLSEADLSRIDGMTATFERPGTRFSSDQADMLAALLPVTLAVQDCLPAMRPVRIVSFKKDAGSNWAVPWHQDRIIAVAERHDVPGFGNWSSKGGVWHCEPPTDILNRMAFVRLHLDPNLADNGPMEIAVGSHAVGVVTSGEAGKVADGYPKEICVASRGDILILQMLTIHRSASSSSAAPRRAIRIDYADFDLPMPLRWSSEGIAV